MNQPVDSSLEEQFDVVIDGGTLEHIFNFPTALTNCMKMTKVGGCVIILTMANNHCGHGFYQFSPELFFRAFQQSNGFELLELVLAEHPYPGLELATPKKYDSVTDPDELKSHVSLVSHSPVIMMVLARKLPLCRFSSSILFRATINRCGKKLLIRQQVKAKSLHHQKRFYDVCEGSPETQSGSFTDVFQHGFNQHSMVEIS